MVSIWSKSSGDQVGRQLVDACQMFLVHFSLTKPNRSIGEESFCMPDEALSYNRCAPRIPPLGLTMLSHRNQGQSWLLGDQSQAMNNAVALNRKKAKELVDPGTTAVHLTATGARRQAIPSWPEFRTTRVKKKREEEESPCESNITQDTSEGFDTD